MNAIIIDDHPLARIAIRNLLDSNGITVAAELDSGAHAVQTAESMQPDLLIVDVDIPELSGIEVLEQRPNARAGCRKRPPRPGEENLRTVMRAM